MSLALVMDLAQGLIFYGGGRGVGWTERWEGVFKSEGIYSCFMLLTHADVWQKLTQCFKAIILQLKKNSYS